MKLKANVYAPILFAVILLFVGISPILFDLVERLAADAFLSSTMIQLFVFLLPLAFYCKVTGFDVVSGLKFRFFSPAKLPFLVNLTAIFFVGALLLRYLGLFFFDSAMVETPAALSLPAESSNAFLNILCAIILPAVLEEAVFRGILLEEYRNYGPVWACATSSLMFAMLHLSLENFVFYLFMGVVLSVITMACDSIVPAILLRVGIGFSHEFVRPSVVEYLRQAGKSPLLPYLLLALFLLLLVFLFSGLENIYQGKSYNELLQSRKELLRKELEKAREVQSAEENKAQPGTLLKLRDVFLSPTFLASIVLFICLVSDVLKRG